MTDRIQRIRIIDSHTGGEPTRVVIAGGPDLGAGPLADRLKVFKNQYDHFRSAVVNEPRGSDVIVGALLCEPLDVKSAAAVIFFNNVGYLGMCGHGTIGVIATLQFLNRIGPGEHKIETPVGTVSAVLHDDRQVTVHNIESFRSAANVEVIVAEYGTVRGDVAWGGNWFFLVRDQRSDLTLAKLDRLTDFTWAVRQALRQNGITGLDGKEIDHIELFGPSQIPGVDSKNFVLCGSIGHEP